MSSKSKGAFDPKEHRYNPTHPVDVHVGNRIALRRNMLKMQAADLAHTMGVSVSQLKKYEASDNRVSASRLYDLAIALEVPIEWFFAGLEGNNYNVPPAPDLPKEDAQLLTDFKALTPGQRSAVKHVMLAMLHPGEATKPGAAEKI